MATAGGERQLEILSNRILHYEDKINRAFVPVTEDETEKLLYLGYIDHPMPNSVSWPVDPPRACILPRPFGSREDTGSRGIYTGQDTELGIG